MLLEAQPWKYLVLTHRWGSPGGSDLAGWYAASDTMDLYGEVGGTETGTGVT